MFLRTLGVVFSLTMASCASNVPLSSAVESTPTGAKLSVLDISKFDRYLSESLQDKNASFEVAFYDRVSPNNVPDRLQKWISVVGADGGEVLVEHTANELVARSPFAAVSFIRTLITSIKSFTQFNSEKIYESSNGRDAVISIEKNSKGEVVVSSIKFVKLSKRP
jgi:hypothetical protein